MYRSEQSFKKKIQKYERQVFNYGPQHTLTEGEIRFKLLLDGESIMEVIPELGYTHRGVEKLLENTPLSNMVCVLDRMGLPLRFSLEQVFVEAIEEMLNLNVSDAIRVVRIILCECERIISHMYNIAVVARYMGGEALFFYVIRFAEYFVQFSKKVLGRQPITNYFTPGGLSFVITIRVLRILYALMQQSEPLMNMMEVTLFNNNIFRQRTSNVGVISRENALEWGLSGPNARASGVKIDLRESSLDSPLYQRFNFQTVSLTQGDVLSRCLVRYQEAQQSLVLLDQCIRFLVDDMLQKGVRAQDVELVPIVSSPFAQNPTLPLYPFSQVYKAVECSRGELGVCMVGSGGDKLTRCKFTTPSFKALPALSKACIGVTLPDFGIIFKSLDIKVAEIDR